MKIKPCYTLNRTMWKDRLDFLSAWRNNKLRPAQIELMREIREGY